MCMCNSMCMLVCAHPWISEIFVSRAHILSKWCHVRKKEQMIGTSCMWPAAILRKCVVMCVIMSEYTCWDMREYLLSFVGKCVFHSLFFPFHSLSPLLSNHTLLIKDVLFISWSHYPVTFLYFSDPTLRFFTPPSYSFSFTSSTSVNTWWVSSHFPPALLPSRFSFCLCHHLHVRNQIKLLPSTDTHMHAVSRPCWGMCISSPPPQPFLLSSTVPHFFTSSFMLSPLSSPLFRLPQSLSIPLHLSVSKSKPESL